MSSLFSLYSKEGKAMVSGLYCTWSQIERIAASKGWIAYDMMAVTVAARSIH